MAQGWCSPGATWAYHLEWLGAEYDMEYGFSHDTVIGGLDAKVSHRRSFGTMGGSPFDQHGWEYTRVGDDVVYQGGSDGGWDTLYWFGGIGDRWWPLGSPMNCPPHGMLEIVDTGHVVFGGLSLRTWDVVTLDSLGEPMFGPVALTERIGMVPRYPEVQDCNMVIDYFFTTFICYSDNDMIALGTEPCVQGVGIAQEEGPPPALRIAPNPARGVARVVVHHWEPGSVLLMIDAVGRISERTPVRSTQAGLDLSGVAPGPYEVVVMHPSGVTERTRLIVY